MITNSSTYKSLVRNKGYSATLDLSFSNVTGEAEIGFSGQGSTYKFSFISGKMLDNSGRYFSSYQPDTLFSLSTNFSGPSYDYTVNDSVVTYSGSKADFYVERFYINPTNVSIDNSIVITTNKPSLTLNYPASFVTGSYITGYLTTNSVSGVKVFTGQFANLSSFEFVSLPEEQIFSNTSGEVLINQKSAAVGDFTSDFTLSTTAGNYSQTIEMEGVEASFLNYVFEFGGTDVDGNNNTDWASSLGEASEQTGIVKSASTAFTYSYETNYESLVPTTLPLYIGLSYYTGATGDFGLVSNVNVTTAGNGYLSLPTVTFSGGGASVQAQGTAVLGATRSNFDKVQSVTLTSFGSGYTSAPSVSFAGGTGILNNASPTQAAATATIQSYSKSFTGCFNLYTGLNGNYVNYLTSNYTTASGYGNEVSFSDFNTPIDIKVEYTSTFDTEPLIALLTISGVNNNIIEKTITGIR